MLYKNRMIELGGNIKLGGFEGLEPAKLIVVKKMVGNYAKRIVENSGEFKELILELKQESYYYLSARLVKDREYNAEVSDKNLFFAIDKVMSKLIEMS